MRRLLKDEGVRLACVSAGGSVMAGVWLAEGLRVLDNFAGRTAPALAACAAVGVVGLTTGVLAAARPARRVRHAARWMSGTLSMSRRVGDAARGLARDVRGMATSGG